MSPAPAKTSAPGDSRDPKAVAVGRRVAGGVRKKQFATRVSKISRSLPDFLATKKTPTLLGRPVASGIAVPEDVKEWEKGMAKWFQERKTKRSGHE